MLELQTGEPACASPLAGPGSLVESLDLLTIVNHRESVQAAATVGAVYRTFEKHTEEYVAVLDGRKILGLCSRGQIGFLLGARYGFAIFSQQPVKNHLLPGFLSVVRGTPCAEVLEAALSRARKEFYDDVALVEADGSFLGIITVETLVRLQSKLVNEKARQAQEHQHALEEVNKSLFRSLHQLHQSQGRYDILFENTALGVALLNSRGEAEATNRRLRFLLERPPGETDESSFELVSLMAEGERERFHCRLVQHAHQDHAARHSDEFKFILPNRGARVFKIFFARIPATGQVCVLLDDISEQRLMERQMAQHEKSALLESLVGGIAHEINNRLSPIVGYTELMLAKAETSAGDNDLVSYCGTVRDNAMESAKIIRQLLQLSKPATLELSSCDLQSLMQDALSLTKFRLREAGVEVKLAVPRGPGPRVFGDSSQIKQVLVNLILNASDAMEESPVRRLTLSFHAAGKSAVFSVQDTGHGIPPERIGRIFDPFFTTKANHRGTGLGLSVCYSIVKQHGGEITVESEPGQGACFQVSLPLADQRAVTLEPEPVPAPAGSGPPVWSAFRALVVDDEQFIVGFVQEALRAGFGCQVEWAFNGRQAIELVKNNNYGLIVSDIRMPQVNGVEFYEWLLVHHPEMAKRFFFITGDPGGSELSARIEQLAIPVLRKPFTLSALVAQSRAILAA
jgi:signal transduction histidine kinase/CheY-like chemotaxis protein